ncbi:LuxR C-terminal-related transcriptional regulator [Roseibium sp. HPY-6]|uniref:LuxR C-terminal-related transcriptional regulator n=1 Tax=Roseibium sp. HPY-6 TaxID=3229852 RepID=UPI00338E342F
MNEAFQLTLREREVLGQLIHAETNRDTARLLSISAKTVGRKLENSYRKLGVPSWAAPAIKSLRSGIAGSRD